MLHEGFYTSGTHSEPAMGICAGWVANDGSHADRQLFHNEQKDIVLVFSGECVADATTLDRLRRAGHEISNDGASWLVHLYEEDGENCFRRLNGLFSGLLIDRRLGRALLFNDRYGFGRIYWCETKDGTYFASEAKALLRILPEVRAFDDEGVLDFLTFGCAIECRTLFRGIKSLPGGSLWSFQNGECHKGRYFVPADLEHCDPLPVHAFESAFQHAFSATLANCFHSESQIGMSLTGGLDSRMIVACRPDDAARTVCHTFAGPKGETLDVRLASRVSKACGLSHEVIRLESDFLADFASYADRTVFITDGNFGIVGAHELYLNKKAREVAPIRLTGVFGGEILRGVHNLKPLGLSRDIMNPALGEAVSLSARRSTVAKYHPVTAAAFTETPWSIFGSLAACRSQVTFRTPYLDNDLVALAYQCPPADRGSPDWALKLIKESRPGIGHLPTDRGHVNEGHGLPEVAARLWREATFKLDYLSNEGLPHWLSSTEPILDGLYSRTLLLGHHKYLRYRRWFRGALAGYMKDAIVASRQSPFWNAKALAEVADRHVDGRTNYVHEINAVLTLDAVDRLLIRGQTGTSNV